MRLGSAAWGAGTYAGTFGEPDYVDGSKVGEAHFNGPIGIAAAEAASSRLYIADTANHRIRYVEPTGVRLLAGNGTQGSVNGAAASANFSHPTGLQLSSDGKLFIADRSANCIRQIDLNNDDEVSTIAGICDSAKPGFLDGPARNARFNFPVQLALASSGALYISDSKNHAIRVLVGENVYTVAGLSGKAGYLEGELHDAQLKAPLGIAMGPSDQVLFFSDAGNHLIRRISCGRVDHLAGTGAGDFFDGAATSARFNTPSGVMYHDNEVFVADTGNNAIRKIYCPIGLGCGK